MFRTPKRRLRDLLRDDTGSVAFYTAMLSVAVIGAGAVAVDIGRMTVLRSEQQNAADARAMAAAVQLDGRDGAQDRATEVINDAMSATSGIPSDNNSLTVVDINFYSEYGATKVVATGDADSQFVEVIMAPRQVDYFFRPVVDMLTGQSSTESASMDALAVVGANPFLCHAPPLMICDFTEFTPPTDLRDPSNYGRQIRLKEPQGGGSDNWAPGNFGLLATAEGEVGASAIEAALAAVTPAECFGYDVDTAPGSKTNKIKDAINARFDVQGNPWPYPAPDVINYPRDAELIASSTEKLGSGSWDITTYWSDKHGAAVPADLTNASRYQAYLYEQGLPYARSDTYPKETQYPVPDPLPAGYTVITPPAASVPVAASSSDEHNNDYDGVPQLHLPVAANGSARRLVEVVQLQCVADDIHGHGTYPTNANYIEMFLTEHVKNPPNAEIYGEIVRAISAINDPDFHANAALVK